MGTCSDAGQFLRLGKVALLLSQATLPNPRAVPWDGRRRIGFPPVRRWIRIVTYPKPFGNLRTTNKGIYPTMASPVWTPKSNPSTPKTVRTLASRFPGEVPRPKA